MTIGGAISDLNNLLKADDIPTYYKPSIKKIIETVEMEQSNSDEDCINRVEAIKALDCEISGSIKSDIDLSKYKREFQEFANIIINAQEKAIQALPPVTPKQKTGHWHKKYEYGNLYCSECNHEYLGLNRKPKFCEECGSKMQEA